VWRELRNVDEYDVLHAHSHLYFSSNLAALRRRMSTTPLAITNHGLYSQTASRRIFELYLRTIGKWTFNKADLVFCYSTADRERLRGLGVDSCVSVVQNGINTERFEPTGTESSLVRNGRSALFVGRLVEGKRPGNAIEAVARARKKGSSIELYLCGEGPLRPELERLVNDLGVEDAVHFLGHVPYDKMPTIYRSVDVLVLPSRTEGVPRSVLEAIASNVPVVCTRLDQLTDIVLMDSRGEFVGLDAIGELADAMCRWTEADIEVEPLGEEYTWEFTVDATTDRLSELAHCR